MDAEIKLQMRAESVAFPQHWHYCGQDVPLPRAAVHRIVSKELERVVMDDASVTDSRGRRVDDYSIYTGLGGVALMWLNIAGHAQRDSFVSSRICSSDDALARAGDAIQRCVRALRPVGLSQGGGFYCGLPGALAVAAVHSAATRNPAAAEYAAELSALSAAVAGPKLNGVNEVLYGRAGYLYCLAFVLKHSVVPSTLLEHSAALVAAAVIAEGRAGAASYTSGDWPLMWEFQGARYAGAAHGVGGILYMLLCWWHVLSADDQRDVRATLVCIASRAQEAHGPVIRVAPGPQDDDVELMHWCHGPPGLIPLMSKAATLFETPVFSQAVRHLAARVIADGALRKGGGLCHGVCGNGYALLSAFKATQDAQYLHYAGCFLHVLELPDYHRAVASYEDPERYVQGTPDRPTSLMEGSAGVICFALDMLFPMFSHLPGFETTTAPPVMDWVHDSLRPLGILGSAGRAVKLAPGVFELALMDPDFCHRFVEDVYLSRPPEQRKVDALRVGRKFRPVVHAVAAFVERFIVTQMLPSAPDRCRHPRGADASEKVIDKTRLPAFAEARTSGSAVEFCRRHEAEDEASEAAAEPLEGDAFVPRLRVWRAYVIRYDAESHPSIQSHTDACDVTVNLCLRRTAERGHLVFNHSGTHYRHTVGNCVVFWGDKVHHTHSISPGGERAQLVLLLNFERPAAQTSEMRRIPASLLNDDVLQDVFGFLPLRDLANVMLCNSHFHRVANAEPVWQEVYRRNAALNAFLEQSTLFGDKMRCGACGLRGSTATPLRTCCDCAAMRHTECPAAECDDTNVAPIPDAVDVCVAVFRCDGCSTGAERGSPYGRPLGRLRVGDVGDAGLAQRVRALYASTVLWPGGWREAYRRSLSAAGFAEEALRNAEEQSERDFWRAIIGSFSVHNIRQLQRAAAPATGSDTDSFATCDECLDSLA